MPNMNLTEDDYNASSGIKILTIKGSIDAYNSELLFDKLDGFIAKGNYKIIVDCKELDFISSSGMGVFMGIEDDLVDNDGDLKFVNVIDPIISVFDKVGLSGIFKISTSIDDAAKELNSWGYCVYNNIPEGMKYSDPWEEGDMPEIYEFFPKEKWKKVPNKDTWKGLFYDTVRTSESIFLRKQ